MKVGDKILCKKDYRSNVYNHFIYVAGQYYIIKSINNFFGFDVVEFNFGDKAFSIDFINNQTNYFYDYFYNIKEMRKLKLNKLNNDN